MNKEANTYSNQATTQNDESQKTNIKERLDFELLVHQDQDVQSDTSIYPKQNTSNIATPIYGVMIGEVLAILYSGIKVKIDGDDNVVLIAQSMVTITASDIGAQCAVMFQNGSVNQPIVMGLVIKPAKSIYNQTNELLLNDIDKNYTTSDKHEEYVTETIPEVLHIQAQQHIIIQCGDAILYMDANGHIETRGNQVLTRATGLNRIKGASVKIN